jgi:hypothetical protein
LFGGLERAHQWISSSALEQFDREVRSFRWVLCVEVFGVHKIAPFLTRDLRMRGREGTWQDVRATEAKGLTTY